MQVLFLKVSGFSSIPYGRISLMCFISSAGVDDRFALFHFCQQLERYILWLRQAFIAPGLKGFRWAVTSKCCFHNSKTKYSSFSLFCCCFVVQRGTKFSEHLFQLTVSVKKPSQRDSLALKRDQQTCLSHDIPAVSHSFAVFCSRW